MEIEDQSVILLKGRLDGNQKNHLAKLLDMQYKPSELADVIGFSVRQIYRVYLPVGCPNQRDETGTIWINGKEFRDWIQKVYQKVKLSSNQAFCLTCKKPVKMANPERIQERRLEYFLCNCPECGRRLARIITRRRSIK